MKTVFISYSRESEPVARSLAGDIEALGHTVWMDNELGGGQSWWDKILATIRDCDVVVVVISPDTLKSTACKREFGYATQLGKLILPVLVSKEVRTNLLPPALSQIQIVDYSEQDKNSALSLGRAFTRLPPSPPLPDQLPDAPDVPMSYLGDLSEQVDAPSLTVDEQTLLVAKLKNALRDPEAVNDARTLLITLRKRRDLLVTTAEDIDEILKIAQDASNDELRSPETQAAIDSLETTEPGKNAKREPADRPQATVAASSEIGENESIPTRKKKTLAGVLGAVLGGVPGFFAGGFTTDSLHGALFFGVVGVIAGFFMATRFWRRAPNNVESKSP